MSLVVQTTPRAETKLKLMVVDDEPDNLDLLYRTFRRDFAVYKADSGFNALEVLDRDGEMAVIVSDQRMPGMNGTEFLSKTVDRFPDTIRIILTGYTDVEDLVGAINSGKVFRYLTKPWSPDELKSVVNQAAETYRVVKRRTNELNRALRRESLFNAMMSAIRESLNYDSMLPTIAQTITTTLNAHCALLQPVEGGQAKGEPRRYPLDRDDWSLTHEDGQLRDPVQAALEHLTIQQTQVNTDGSDSPGGAIDELLIPLVYQQECLALLSLVRQGQPGWQTDEVALISELTEQAALALSQARLYQRTEAQTQQFRMELEVARQVQADLLRQHWPEVLGVRVQAECQPAREVGGDFFEVFVHPQGDVWLAVGDVSGKGVPAALFMASSISVLRQELARAESPEPDEAIRRLNRALFENLFNSNRFITIALARYTPSTRRLSYANAGHVYPVVWSPQVVQEKVLAGGDLKEIEPTYLKARGVPLGILPEWKGTGGEQTLEPGEALLMASDGITEATVANIQLPGTSLVNGSMLQQEGLWELLKQQGSPFDLKRLLATLQQVAPDEQEDDQTLLLLEVL
ncbi:MAG: SpoIIE family protein phosphatase [Limnothrix sp. BL-A-16]|jgi:serine phosphatase RsbU (regulator of sigma subunit)/FixJ family two-component response regulator